MKQVVELEDIEDSIRNENGTFYFAMKAVIKTDPDKWVGKGIASYFGTQIDGSRIEIKFIPKEADMEAQEVSAHGDRYFLCRMLDGKTVTVRMIPHLIRGVIGDVALLSQSTMNVDVSELNDKVALIRMYFIGKTLQAWHQDMEVSGL